MNLSAENMGKIRELVRSGYPLKARDAQDLQGHNDHLIELLEARGRLMLGVEIERDQLRTENERLRKLPTCWSEVVEQSEANDQLLDRVLALSADADRFQFIAQDAESSLVRIYGDDWLAVVDALMGMGKGESK